jgi:hypothetical protein
VTSKQVVYRDERNASVGHKVVEVGGGWTDADLPTLLAKADQWDGTPDDFKVLRVLDVTGDPAIDECALLTVQADLVEADAVRLRAILANGTGPIAQALRREGVDEQFVAEHYDQVAAAYQARADALTPRVTTGEAAVQ